MSEVEERLRGVLEAHLSPILARSVMSYGLSRTGVSLRRLRPGDVPRLIAELETGVRLYVKDTEERARCMQRLTRVLGSAGPPDTQRSRVVVKIDVESDVVAARVTARDMCRDLGFSPAEQVKVATAVSELARNIVGYAGKGEVILEVVSAPRSGLSIEARDDGPGIADLPLVLEGDYRSKTGMGVGLRGTRKLMDEFDIQTAPGQGTRVKIRKYVH